MYTLIITRYILIPLSTYHYYQIHEVIKKPLPIAPTDIILHNVRI